jgi:hypothetical protein
LNNLARADTHFQGSVGRTDLWSANGNLMFKSIRERIHTLDGDCFEELMRRPKSLVEQLLDSKKLVVIDEVQKLPKILDEVHRLIEERGVRFLLTGSTVRKRRRGSADDPQKPPQGLSTAIGVPVQVKYRVQI